jgi:hypothetical protein
LSTSMSSVPCSTSLRSLATEGLLSTDERILANAPFEGQGESIRAVVGELEKTCRGPDREPAIGRDRVCEPGGEDSRTLAAVGAFAPSRARLPAGGFLRS